MAPHRPVPTSHDERGIALVAAVLVVLLTSLLIAAFMTTTTGERALSSNVQTAKVSLYAADAGVRTVEQDLSNKAQAKYDSCVTAWNNAGSSGQIITSPSTLFPSGTLSAQTSSTPNFSSTGSIAFSEDTVLATKQTYYYNYTVQSSGTVASTGTRRVQAQGVIQLSAARGSFADYLMFMNVQQMSDGSDIWFTSNTSFDGRVHTNDIFHFAFKPTFQDLVTSVSPNAVFFNNGNQLTLNANNNGSTDAPNFYNGFQRNQPSVAMPTNTWNQQEAAIGSPSVTTNPTTSAINTALGVSGSSTPNGIYVVSTAGNVTTTGATGTMTGGIYVQGDLTQATMWADTVANRQWYQLSQGSTYKTIMVDATAGQTKVWNSQYTTGTPNLVATGVPLGIMYVNGGINDLTGPNRSNGNVLPAVAEGTKLFITAAKDIVIQGDVTLDSYNNNDNVLGLMSGYGGIRIGTSAPADVNVDAFIMAAATTSSFLSGWSSNYPGQFAVDSYDSGSPRGTMHLRGGVITQYYGAFGTFDSNSGNMVSGYARDFHYDRRGLIPPYFPQTTRFVTTAPVARTLAWKEI